MVPDDYFTERCMSDSARADSWRIGQTNVDKMVYITSWQEYQEAAEGLYERSPNVCFSESNA